MLEWHDESVMCVKIKLDCNIILSASYDKKIVVWNLISGNIVRILEEHKNEVRCLEISYNEDYFVTAGNDQFVRIWDKSYLEKN